MEIDKLKGIDFEGIKIWIHKIELNIFKEVIEDFVSAKSEVRIWKDTVVNGMPERKDIVGEVQVLFKDGGGDIEINLFINCNISAQAGRDSESADTMCKFIKWLFGWTSSYIIENNITDKNGKLFTVPEFKYTKDSFKQGYPD